MEEGQTTRCIECGGFADSLNEDETGEPCNACADRLLETLPGVFHKPWTEEEVAAQDLLSEEAEAQTADERSSPRRVEDAGLAGFDEPA